MVEVGGMTVNSRKDEQSARRAVRLGVPALVPVTARAQLSYRVLVKGIHVCPHIWFIDAIRLSTASVVHKAV